MQKQRSWGWIFAAFTALALSGCGGGDQSFNDDGGGDGGGGNTGGTPATLSVATAQAAIVADGQSTALITATLLDTTGAPVAGRAVSFETSAGTLQAATATTSNTGQASVRLQAPQVIGRAVVTAREANSGLSAVTEVGFISAAPASVAIQAAPSTIRPGAATSITVSVSDANGNPVGGEILRLDTPRNESAGLFESAQVTTDANGRAQTSYTAGRSLGTDTLRVQTAGGRASTTDLTVTAGAALVGALTLDLGSTQLVGDGRSATVARATVVDTAGDPLAGLTVTFSTTAGTLANNTAVTNADGVAQVSLTAPTRVGNATVAATTGGFSASQGLAIVSGPVSQVLLSVAPSSLAPGAGASLRAVALDANGNRVTGEVLTLSSTAGALLSPVSVTTDENGEASAQYTAGSSAGTDTVRARSAGGVIGATNVTVDARNVRITSIDVVAGASSATVGGQPVAIRATLTTASGSSSGLTVLFSTTAGSLSSGQAVTNAQGVAEVLLTPGTVPGSATVTASSAGFQDSVVIQLAPGPVAQLALAVAPTAIAPGASATARAIALDASGNRIAGETVTFSSSTGASITPASVTTDENGEAITQYVASSTAGTDTVRARTANGTSVATRVSIDPSNARITGISVVPGAPVTVVGGQPVAIRATVSSNSGVASGITVLFSATAGSLSATQAVTNSQGVAEVFLSPPNLPGSATITASSAGFQDSTTVRFDAGTVSTLTLTLSAAQVAVNGTVTLRATALDSRGNPVVGTPVVFDVPTNRSGGTLASVNVLTDANGVASTAYTAGSSNGSTVIDRLRVRSPSQGVAAQVAELSVVVAAARLDLSATSQQLVANGTDSVTLSAQLSNADGTALQGVPVRFRASAGSFSPSTPVTTDASGVASVVFRGGTVAGSVGITATAPGVSGSLSLNLVPGELDSLTLEASPLLLPPAGTTTLTIVARDANGNRVAAEELRLEAITNASGGQLSSTRLVTNDSGVATATYVVGQSAGSDVIEVVSSGAANDRVTVNVSAAAATVSSLALASGSPSVVAGGPVVAFDASVTDNSGRPVSGLAVNFTANDGQLSNGGVAVTDQNGTARVLYSAPTFATVDTVRASAAGFLDELSIQVIPGEPEAARSSITANPATLVADGASQTTVTVVLNDVNGNPVANGRSVTLLAGSAAGLIVGSNTSTIVDGRASFTLQAPDNALVATLSIQDIPSLSTVVNFESSTTGDPASIQFAVASPQISVTGVGSADQTAVTVSVLDSAGNLIDESLYPDPALNNLRARFVSRPGAGETLSGRDAAGNVVTAAGSGVLDVRTRGGIAVLTLQSGTISGIVEIEFSVLEFSGSDLGDPAQVGARAVLPQVSIASGPPSTIAFTGPITGAIENLENGNYRLRGKVDVTDRYGNWVPDGTVVNFAMMDSVIVHDTTGATAAGTRRLNRSGASLIRRRCAVEPVPGGEASGCTAPGALTSASDFSSTIVRNGVGRGIEPGDLVLIRNAENLDKRRTVSEVASPTRLNVLNAYLNDLAGGEFWTGSALLGSTIAGFDEDNTLIPGTGVVRQGVAEFRVTYPANVGSILTGCYGYPFPDRSYDDRDKRDSVPQSRQVILSASAGDGVSAINQGDFCFKAISGGTLTPSLDEVALGQQAQADIGLDLRDGGDQIPLPYVDISCFFSSFTRDPASTFQVSITVLTNSDGDRATDVGGLGAVRVRRTDSGPAADGDEATVQCVAGAVRADPITVTPIVP